MLQRFAGAAVRDPILLALFYGKRPFEHLDQHSQSAHHPCSVWDRPCPRLGRWRREASRVRKQSVRCLRPTFLRLTFVLLILAVAAAFAQNSATPQNVEFSTTIYEAPAFYATFPVPDKGKGAVAYSSEDIKTKSGTATTLHNYALSLHNDEYAFLVLYCDIPNTRFHTAAHDQM